jgi:hypothetical protein
MLVNSINPNAAPEIADAQAAAKNKAEEFAFVPGTVIN